MFVKEDFIIIRENAKSTRKYYKTYCDTCGVDRGYHRISKARTPNCKVCAPRLTHKGKVVSEETRAKMRESSWSKRGFKPPKLGSKHSKLSKLKISEAQAKFCKEHGNQFAGRTHTQETIALLSKVNAGRAPRWKGRTFQYSGPNGTFKMRSSYELAYANWMDASGIIWKYEPSYTLNDGRTFSPDFLLLECGTIVEVKGYWTIKGKDKWDAFCSSYPDLKKKVIYKEDLKALALI